MKRSKNTGDGSRPFGKNPNINRFFFDGFSHLPTKIIIDNSVCKAILFLHGSDIEVAVFGIQHQFPKISRVRLLAAYKNIHRVPIAPITD